MLVHTSCIIYLSHVQHLICDYSPKCPWSEFAFKRCAQYDNLIRDRKSDFAMKQHNCWMEYTYRLHCHPFTLLETL